MQTPPPPPPYPADPSLVHRGTGPVATVYMTVPSTAPDLGGRAAAVKVYPSTLDRATTTELLEEQRTLAAMRSVSSILLIDRLEDLPGGPSGSRAAIWMELCTQSLAELVDVGGPLSVPDVLGLAETIATVLTDAHAVGIVHGGVTPSNVLFRSAGQPVLADFGLGLRQLFPRQPEAAAAYTAPEVLRGEEPAAAADLYGLGAVLHFALTGSSPFPSRTGEPAGEVLLRALNEPPPTVSGLDLPPTLPALVTALLAKNPADRPGSAAQVLDVVRELTEPAGGQPEAESPDDTGPDFDDFRDELPATRESVAWSDPAPPLPPPPAPPPPYQVPASPGSPGSPPPASPRRKKERPAGKGRWQIHPAVPAAVAVLAVVIVLVGALGGGRDTPDTTASTPVASQPATRTAVPEPDRARETSSPPAPPSVRLEIHKLTDNGDKVTLGWRSAKPLTYAVIIAEQGKSKPSTRFRGTARTLTVPVRPNLKYCFRVQGTDGTHTYESPVRSIRGAKCRG